MDKQLLEALNNLSVALERVASSLIDKAQMKTPVGTAMASGDFSKSLTTISDSISRLETNQETILDKQNTILQLVESKKPVENTKVNSIKSVPSIIKPSTAVIPLAPDSIRPSITTSIVKPPKVVDVPSEKSPDSVQEKKKGIFPSIFDFFRNNLFTKSIDEKSPVTTSIVKPSEVNSIDSKVPPTTSIIKPPTFTPATPITPAGPIKPVTPILPIKPAATTSIIKPPTFTPATPITPDGPIKPVTPILPIKPAATTSIIRPPTFTPATPITPAGPIKPVSTMLPIKPVGTIGITKPPTLTDSAIRPAVQTSKKPQTPALENPYFKGGNWSGMPVIPVAVVSFRDGSQLFASGSAARVVGIGRIKQAKDMSRPSAETTSKDSIESRKSNPQGSQDPNNRDKRPGEKKAQAQNMSRPSAENVSKQEDDKKKKGLFSSDQKKSIGDGVKLLLLMAVGIIAIGLAFKIVGSVNIGSVLALAIALPLVAIAFEKISRVKISAKEMFMVSLSLVIMAGAILISSFILSKVKPIGMAQAFATIVIAGTFAIISSQMGKLIRSLGKINPFTAFKAALLMPIVLVAVSYAIMKSSEFIRNVKPIGFQQAFSTLVIAGTFAIISLSIGRLISAFGGVNPMKALIAVAIMPLVLIGVSYAIMKSSDFIRNVKPIGFQQAFSSIVIAGVFAIVGFGIGKILKAFDEISPIEAIAFAAIGPLILIGISYAIMKSSEFIRNVKPVGFQQFFASVVISLVFVILSFGIKQIVRAFDKISLIDITKAAIFAPIILIAMSYAIMESSQFIRNVKPIGFQQFFASIMISIIFVVLSFAVKFIVKNTRGITAKDMVKGGLILVAMAVGILAASLLIKLIPNVSNSQFASFIKLSLVLVSLAGIALAITKITKNISQKELIKATLTVVAIALMITLTSQILSLGDYTKFPPATWALSTTFAIGVYSLLAFGLSILIKKVGKKDFMFGALAIVVLSIAIALASQILSTGDYSKFPSVEWSLTTAFTIGLFGIVAVGLGFLIKKVGVKEALVGALAIVVLSAAIALSSQILSLGDYTKYPSLGYSLGVGLTLTAFGIASLGIGSLILSSGGLAAGAMALGAAAILGLAATIVATDKILGSGSYTNFPGSDWIGSVAKTLILFGTAVVTLGAISAGGGLLEGISFGLVKNPIDAGIDAVRKISEIIVETSSILAGGDYGNFPTNDWISGVSKTLLLFGTAVVTLGAISSGGGALEGISFGLVKNPIKSGIEAIKDIAKSIVDADTILASGSYTGGPKKEWSEGIGLALGAFSNVYKLMMGSEILNLFTGGKVGNETFTGAIKSISTAIKDAGDLLSDGNFMGGPKPEWAMGVGIAIGAFSDVYDMMSRNQILKFFSKDLGISVESFSTSIRTISQGIKDASLLLGSSTFTGGPDETWAKGVGLAIGAFSEVYAMLQKQKIFDLFLGAGAGVDIESFKSAIVTISEGLKSARDILTKEEGWTGGPSDTWAAGVGQSIAAFAPVFTAVAATKGFFVDGPPISEFKDAIVTIAQGIIEAAGVFNGTESVFDLTKIPKAEWGQNVGAAINAFAPVFDYLNKNTGWFTSGAEATEDLKNAIVTISNSIKDSSNALALGKYDYEIDAKWGKSVSILYKKFIDIFSDKDLDTDADKLKEKSTAVLSIAQSIKSVSVALSTGLYTTVFDKFDKTMPKLISSFTGLFKKLPDTKDLKQSLTSMLSISQNIKQVSFILSVGKYGTKFGEFEKSSTSIISSFIKLINKISDIKSPATKFITMLSLARNIRDVSNILSTGKYTVSMPKDYLAGFVKAVESLLVIVKKVKNLKNDDIKKVLTLPAEMQKMSISLSKIKFVNIPDKWIDTTFNTLNKFADLIKVISKKSNTSDTKKIEKLSISMLMIDKLLALGKYKTFPPQAWIENVSKVILKYAAFILSINKSFAISTIMDGVKKINAIVKNIAETSINISTGKYSKYPSSSWVRATEIVVKRFGDLSAAVDKRYGVSSLKSGLLKILNISKTIASISKNLSSGQYRIFPGMSWSTGVPRALQGFMNLKFNTSIVDYLFPKDEKTEKNKIAKVIDLMLFVDRKFKAGNWTKFPTLSWANGTIAALSKFSNILRLLDFKNLGSGLGKNTGIISAIGNIDLLTRAFDKLGTSIDKFTKSVDVIDAQKLESIRTLTSNVVLLSMMDPNQFETMMSKLESKSQVFSGLINDTRGKSSASSAPASSGSVRTSGVVSMGSVNKPSSGGGDIGKLSSENQSKITMDKLVAIMSDIASVVGSKGTLMEYIESLKSEDKGAWFGSDDLPLPK